MGTRARTLPRHAALAEGQGVRYADRDEIFEVGDAFYTPPGHVPVKNEPGTEILWFSPS
jgi:ribosomal protein L16 Arg81 hydroxylase